MQNISQYQYNGVVAGCDEAGRGCLAGPVFAAAVVLPQNFSHPRLTDSKLLTSKQRKSLRKVIEKDALYFAVAKATVKEIDHINILNASFKAMHKALKKLTIIPELILVDGNRFNPYYKIPFECIVKGDSKFFSIAAASILAKEYRDDYMTKISKKFPVYQWEQNKGYPTQIHRTAIVAHGPCPHHRTSFRLYPDPPQ